MNQHGRPRCCRPSKRSSPLVRPRVVTSLNTLYLQGRGPEPRWNFPLRDVRVAPDSQGRRAGDEHPALPRLAERRVVAERVADEVGELGERLHARVARADEDERELTLAVRLVRRRRGGLEAAQDVVPEGDRVGERLEAERV